MTKPKLIVPKHVWDGKQAEQKKQSSEDARRRATQLASLATQQGSSYNPPKPSGSK